MSDWTSPEGIAHLRALLDPWLPSLPWLADPDGYEVYIPARKTCIPCVPDGRAELIVAAVNALPALLDALEAAERERDLLLARLRAAHGALADASDVRVPGRLDADIAPAIRRLTEQRDEARALAVASGRTP